MSEEGGFYDTWRKAQSSPGSSYVNQAHERSFSKNIFRINAIELIDSALRVKDPEQGFFLMRQGNREAGLQAHRELSRHIHNFVAAAMTLVEHTRKFMRTNYEGQAILDIYEKEAKARFVTSPVAQFVQELRNYMVHKGLPSSSMYMTMKAQPDSFDGSMSVETGVRFQTEALLEGYKWNGVARQFLTDAGEYLHVHDFANEYVDLVDQFHGWLDSTLEEHHRSDLEDLVELGEQLRTSSRPVQQVAEEIGGMNSSHDTCNEFNLEQIAAIDRQSAEIAAKIMELHLKQAAQGFVSEKKSHVITEKDIVGSPKIWGENVDGEYAFSFIARGDSSFGLVGSDYAKVDTLVDSVMRSSWARSCLSRPFIENTFLEWAQRRFEGESSSFSDALCVSARESIVELEVWAPIAWMEVEEGFEFGSVRIEPVTASAISSFMTKVQIAESPQADAVGALFSRLRDEIQGGAAVVIRMKGEPLLTKDRSLEIAKDSIGLLRFFAPGANDSSRYTPIALAGAEYLPKSKMISVGEGTFSLTEGISGAPPSYWRLSKSGLSKLKAGLLDHASALIDRPDAGTLASEVRESILAYSKGSTLVEPLDRLRSTLFAVETLFLRHRMESRAEVLSTRLGRLLATESAEVESIGLIVRKICWLQQHPQGIGSDRRADTLIGQFTSLAYLAIIVALENSRNFRSKDEFLDAVERMRGPSAFSATAL